VPDAVNPSAAGPSGRHSSGHADPRQRTISGRRRLAIILLTLNGVMLLGLAVLEAGFRLAGGITDVSFYMWEPCLGLRMAPNQEGRYRHGNFVDGRFHFNAQGWNHPDDYVVAKRPGVRRVCLIGDSMVEALQVRPQETMFAVAEREMGLAGTPAQWYAFGVSGYGTAQEYEVIRRFALDYQPDVVILLFVQNDPFDTSPYLVDLEPYVVRYVLDESEVLSMIFPTEWRPSWWRRFSARSALVRYIMVQKGLLNRFRYRKTESGVGGLPVRENVSEYRHPIVQGLATQSMNERQEKTWLLIARLLEAARDECRRRGAIFAVAFRGWRDEIDTPIQPESADLPPKEADPYCLKSRIREMGREQVAPIAARLGIPYLDLTEALRASVARTGRSHCFPDDSHYSAAGHAAAGEALAAWVETLRH
jgi:lysophospholipase L1-like esterase